MLSMSADLPSPVGHGRGGVNHARPRCLALSQDHSRAPLSHADSAGCLSAHSGLIPPNLRRMGVKLTKDSIDLGIVVSDITKALAFYRDFLGLPYQRSM